MPLHLVLAAQPPTEPATDVAVHGRVGFAHRSEAEVIGPTHKQAVEFGHQLFDRAKFPVTAGLFANGATELDDLLL